MRFHEIDLLRFLAALAVVFFHYAFRGAAGDAPSEVAYPELAGAAKYGYLGVDLFFIISGFVILMTATGKSAGQFVISRIIRLYPAFWCCATITFLASIAFCDPRFPVASGQYLANLTMFSGFVGIPSIDGVYWSLFVEMKFYFLVFLLVSLRQIRFVDHYLGAWLAASLLLTLHPIRGLGGLLMPHYAAYFVAGAVFYRIAQSGNSLYRTLLLLVSFGLAMIHAQRNAAMFGQLYETRLSFAVVATAVAGFYGLFYLIATRKTPWLAWKQFAWFGVLTYPLYLLHQHVGFMLFNRLHPWLNRYVLLCGVVALMLALSYWVHRRIENVYAQPLRQRLEKGLAWLKAAVRSSRTEGLGIRD